MKRPITVTIIAILLLLAGAVSLIGDAVQFKALASTHLLVMIVSVQLLAIVAGIFLLRRSNWARMLAVSWMAFHVGISIGHPLAPLLVHMAFLLLLAWFLYFAADARAWFGHAQTAA
jgi:hypothetical protein